MASRMSRVWVRILLWGLVLATAGMIFCFSAQNGTASSQLSGGITEKVVEVVEPDYDSLPEPEQQTLFDAVQFAVRKSAHFSEYALLGFLLRLLCASYALRRGGLVAWLCGTGYAATDELHQWFVAARSAMWQDVCLDSVGVFAGAFLATGILVIYARISMKRRKRG
mgnify:CR=1 FL=1